MLVRSTRALFVWEVRCFVGGKKSVGKVAFLEKSVPLLPQWFPEGFEPSGINRECRVIRQQLPLLYVPTRRGACPPLFGVKKF